MSLFATADELTAMKLEREDVTALASKSTALADHVAQLEIKEVGSSARLSWIPSLARARVVVGWWVANDKNERMNIAPRLGIFSMLHISIHITF